MRDIKGYEGLYAVTSCGKVWSYRSKKFLNLYKDGRGYQFAVLSKNGNRKTFMVHRLVAEAYIPNPDNLPQVNHKDEIKFHNWINNLEWCDAKYNTNYGTRNEKIANKRKKKVRCIETGETFDTITEAANSVNRAVSTMSGHLNGHRKTCAGYHWEFIEVEV